MSWTVGPSAASSSLQMTPNWVVQLTHLRDLTPYRRVWTSSRGGPKGSKVQGSAFKWGKCPVSVQSGGWTDWDQPCEEGPGVLVDEPRVCIRSPEDQQHPRLNQKQCNQQTKESDSTLLLFLHETSTGVLHPPPQFSAQWRHVSRMVPEEGRDDKQKAGTPPLCRESRRNGDVQSGYKKALGRPYCSLRGG